MLFATELLTEAERRVQVHQAFAIPNVSIPKDVHWGDVTDQILAQSKLDLLQKISIIALNKTSHLKSCGLNFKINTHFDIPEALSPLLTTESRVHLEFHWFDCERLGMNNLEFEDESGQDCVLFNSGDWEFSVQRDFVAAKNNHQSVLISFAKIADGLQNSLRCFIPRMLLEKNFYVLHCSAVAINDHQAIAFMGPSGVGKSTIISKSPALTPLHDDMNILRLGPNQKVFIKGAELGSILVPDRPEISKEFELVALYQLKQADQNEVLELKTPDGFSLILSNFANYFWETLSPQDVEQLTNAAHSIASSLAICEFRNNADFDVWKILGDRHGLS